MADFIFPAEKPIISCTGHKESSCGIVMRNLLALLLFCAALPALGADRPGNLQPIPDPPPPPASNRIPHSNRRSRY